MKNLSQQLPFVFLLIFTSYFSYSQNPSRDLQDIVGERGSYAEMDLEKRGYVHIKTSKLGYDVYSSWWNPGKKKCITYHLADGSVRSVTDVPSFDCNKSSGEGYSSNISYNHYSHHHSNNSHYDSRDHDEAFERGHNDGLYNKAYHNIFGDSDLKMAYSDGYQSGVNQRGSNTRYHSNRGGYQSHARVDDVVGMSNDRTLETLVQRGFTMENRYAKDGRLHRIFYNPKTKQCIDVIGRDKHTRRVENSSRCN